jgi:hypothetical protein
VGETVGETVVVTVSSENGKLTVYEVSEGQWTHEFADGETWPKAKAILVATRLASMNGLVLDVDFPIETKLRAVELNIDLNAKPTRRKMIVYPPPERFDPFA